MILQKCNWCSQIDELQNNELYLSSGKMITWNLTFFNPEERANEFYCISVCPNCSTKLKNFILHGQADFIKIQERLQKTLSKKDKIIKDIKVKLNSYIEQNKQYNEYLNNELNKRKIKYKFLTFDEYYNENKKEE